MLDFKPMLLASVIGTTFITNVMASEESLDNLSTKLIEIRGEVEKLNSEINFIKDEHKQEMNYLWTQKNDFQAQFDRNIKTIEKLQIELDKKVAENAEKGKTSASLRPVFMEQVEIVNQYIQNSIPFKKNQRLADLKEVKDQVNKELISTQRGFNKLWALLEDEIRLTRETGLYQQSIQIEGKEGKKLVDIARLGMMNIYFSTPEGQYGQLKKANSNEWTFKVLEDAQQSKQIKTLFDSLNKQVRTGLFTLPMMNQQ